MTERLFTGNQVSNIVSSIDVDELCDTRTLKVDDNTEVKVYFGNVGFDAVCYRWGLDEYGDMDWLEAGRACVIGTDEFEDDLLYGVSLALERATMPC